MNPFPRPPSHPPVVSCLVLCCLALPFCLAFALRYLVYVRRFNLYSSFRFVTMWPRIWCQRLDIQVNSAPNSTKLRRALLDCCDRNNAKGYIPARRARQASESRWFPILTLCRRLTYSANVTAHKTESYTFGMGVCIESLTMLDASAELLKNLKKYYKLLGVNYY